MRNRREQFENWVDNLADYILFGPDKIPFWVPDERRFDMRTITRYFTQVESVVFSAQISGLSEYEQERTQEIFQTRAQVQTLINTIHDVVTENPFTKNYPAYEVTFYNDTEQLPLSYRTTKDRETPLVTTAGSNYRIGASMEFLEERSGETHAREVTTAELKALRIHVADTVHGGTHFQVARYIPPKPPRRFFRR